MSAEIISNRIHGGLWGSLIGDALGVPVEFRSRSDVQIDPVTDMRAFGTHRQPKGTWSEDGALILCTADSLVHSEFDTIDTGGRFVKWMNEGLWAAAGEAFDVGCTTADALTRIADGIPAEEAGGQHEDTTPEGRRRVAIPVHRLMFERKYDRAGERMKKINSHFFNESKS